jgi:hypothetical protein
MDPNSSPLKGKQPEGPVASIGLATSSLGRQSFQCEALRDLQPGEEIFWVYNAHSHDGGWLLGHGFIPSDGTSKPSLVLEDVGDREGAVAAIDIALKLISELSPDQRKIRAGIEDLLVREREVLANAILNHLE